MDCFFYPGNSNRYVTIEVVKKDQRHRLRFKKKDEDVLSQERPLNHKPQDLIDEMIQFYRLGFKLLNDGKIPHFVTACPFHHCLVSFEHPDLKPFLLRFKKAAHDEKEKQTIIMALKNEPDRERRQAAAFLVGHFSDSQEIIKLLKPYVLDTDEGLRNNAIRVMIFTMMKEGDKGIDITPFITLLDSPCGTDRNKALYLLLQTSFSDKNKKLILQKAGSTLVDLLALKQPNNHDPAYALLKQVSGQHYGEYDLTAWQNWLREIT